MTTRTQPAHRRRSVMTGGLAAVVLALAACSSSAKTGSSTTTTATTASAGAATTAAASSDASTTTDPKFTGAGSAAFCSYVKQINDQETLVTTIFSTQATPAQVKQAWAQLDAVISQLVSSASSEIKADATVLQQAYQQLEAVFVQYGYDSSKVFEASQADPNVASKLQVADDPKFTAAADRIEAYNEKICGITPSTAPPTT
jgi:hypothetical protein